MSTRKLTQSVSLLSGSLFDMFCNILSDSLVFGVWVKTKVHSLLMLSHFDASVQQSGTSGPNLIELLKKKIFA